MTDVLASLHPKPVPARSSTEDPRAIQHDFIEPVDSGQFWSSDEGPTFAEFLDIINPLQHIPVVSTIYRAITGDQIGPGPRFLGGALFGGPAGAIGAGIASLFEEASGGDLGQHLAQLADDITGDNDDADPVPAPAGRPDAGTMGRTANGPAEQPVAICGTERRHRTHTITHRRYSRHFPRASNAATPQCLPRMVRAGHEPGAEQLPEWRQYRRRRNAGNITAPLKTTRNFLIVNHQRFD